MTQAKKSFRVLGAADNIVERPEIRLENLDVEKLDKGELTTDGKFYDGICIPLKFSDYDRLAWEFVWCWFNDQYVNEGGEDDTVEDQPINLQLYIEDNQNTDEREYTLSAFIKVDDYDKTITECMTEEIRLTQDEVKAVSSALKQLHC